MPKAKISLSGRAGLITPFQVMDILSQAKQLEAQGRDIIHLEVGEPDFSTPEPIVQAGIEALQTGKTHYTASLGLPALRQAIANWYQTQYQVTIEPERIVVTPGASGALLLLMGAVLGKGQNVLLADPGYPCNRNFALFLEAKAKSIAVTAKNNYQLTSSDIDDYWDEQTALALLASPSNPTGSVLSRANLSALAAAVKAKNGLLAVDEIYHGLIYDEVDTTTALAIDDDAFVINSFSKHFGMTGWRLGWLVAPKAYISVMDRLAQNLFLAAPTMSQYAALAAFSDETNTILQRRHMQFQRRRDVLLTALRKTELEIKTPAQGAFYIYADCSKLLNEQLPDSMALTKFWLEKASVAVTPGNDFGDYLSSQHVRFAYTADESRIVEAIERIIALH